MPIFNANAPQAIDATDLQRRVDAVITDEESPHLVTGVVDDEALATAAVTTSKLANGCVGSNALGELESNTDVCDDATEFLYQKADGSGTYRKSAALISNYVNTKLPVEQGAQTVPTGAALLYITTE